MQITNGWQDRAHVLDERIAMWWNANVCCLVNFAVEVEMVSTSGQKRRTSTYPFDVPTSTPTSLYPAAWADHSSRGSEAMRTTM